jgi:hypothetical protein
MQLPEKINKIVSYLIENSDFYKDPINGNLILNRVSDLKKNPFYFKRRYCCI